MSAALQLVVVTALYRPGKSPCALEASPKQSFGVSQGGSAVQSCVVPAERNPTPGKGLPAAAVLDHGEGGRW